MDTVAERACRDIQNNVRNRTGRDGERTSGKGDKRPDQKHEERDDAELNRMQNAMAERRNLTRWTPRTGFQTTVQIHADHKLADRSLGSSLHETRELGERHSQRNGHC